MFGLCKTVPARTILRYIVMRRISFKLFTAPLGAALLAGGLASICDVYEYRAIERAIALDFRDELTYSALHNVMFAIALKPLILLSSPLICVRSARPMLSWLFAGSLIASIVSAFVIGDNFLYYHPSCCFVYAYVDDVSVLDSYLWVSILAYTAYIAVRNALVGAAVAGMYRCNRRTILFALLLGFASGCLYLIPNVLLTLFAAEHQWVTAGFFMLFVGNVTAAVSPLFAVPRDQHIRLGWGPAAKLEKLIRRTEDVATPALQFELGEQFFNAGDYVGALDQFRRVLSDDPNLTEGYYLAGICCEKLKRREDAMQYYEQMMARKDARKLRFGLAWLAYAECLAAEGHDEAALEQLKAVVREYPRPRTEIALAKQLRNAGDLEHCIRIIDDIIATAAHAPKEDKQFVVEANRLRSRL
jgi:hypothetical protein